MVLSEFLPVRYEPSTGECRAVSERYELVAELVQPPSAAHRLLLLITDGFTGPHEGSFKSRAVTRIRGEDIQTCIIRIQTQEPFQQGTRRATASDLAEAASLCSSLLYWFEHDPGFEHLPRCVLASAEGASVILMAAAIRPASLAAIAIGQARPLDALPVVSRNVVPTLFAIGDADTIAGPAVRAAYAATRGLKQLLVLPDTGHTFEPPNDEVFFRESLSWFRRHALKS